MLVEDIACKLIFTYNSNEMFNPASCKCTKQAYISTIEFRVVYHVFSLTDPSLIRYGYRGLDGRNNLFVLPSGEVLYCVGAVAVLYDKEADQQRHYIGHNEDITR